MGGKASTPKAPDYSALANQQSQLDRQTAGDITTMNRVNQIDPYGQTTWSRGNQDQLNALNYQLDYMKGLQDPNNPSYNPQLAKDALGQQKDLQAKIDSQMNNWTQTTTLNPEQQALLNQQTALQGQQNTRLGQLLSSFQTPTAPTLGQGFALAPERQLKDASQNDIQNLLYGQITKQYDDRFARDEAAQRANLANQGFQMGSEGYQNTLGDFAKQKNSAYQDAATQAALSSYDQMNKERALNQSEYGALSSNDLNRFSAQNSNELNRYGAGLNGYNSQMGYLSQLLGGVQGPTNPQYQPFSQATQYQSPDILGAAQQQYQAKVGNANASNAAKGQTMGTVGTVATAAAVAY